jgi:hypothetical protein
MEGPQENYLLNSPSKDQTLCHLNPGARYVSEKPFTGLQLNHSCHYESLGPSKMKFQMPYSTDKLLPQCSIQVSGLTETL